MRKRKKLLLFTGLGLALALAVLIWLRFRTPVVTGDINRLEASVLYSPMRGSLQRRAPSEGDPDLLLRRADDNVVARPGSGIYFYDSRSGSLELLSASVWNRATGPIAREWDDGFSEEAGTLQDSIRIENRALFFFSGDRVPTRGRYAVGALSNPTGNIVAVLSADGPILHFRGSIVQIPFLGTSGGSRCVGQHYVEFLDFPSMQRLGEPVRIDKRAAERGGCEGWSPDGRYIIYSANLGRVLWIVPVPSKEK